MCYKQYLVRKSKKIFYREQLRMKKRVLILLAIIVFVVVCFYGFKNFKSQNNISQPQQKKNQIIDSPENINPEKEKYIPSGYYYGIDEPENILEITPNEMEENNFDINISILRLASMDGTGIMQEDNSIQTNLIDPSENNLKAEIIYDEETHRLKFKVSESKWGLLNNGTEFIFDARNYPVDTQTIYELFESFTGYSGTAGAMLKNAKNAFDLIDFIYKTRFYDLNDDDLKNIFSDAYKQLSAEQKSELDNNFDDVIRPLAENVFVDRSTVQKDFYNAGLYDELNFYINYNQRFNISLGLEKFINIYYAVFNGQNKK